MVRRLSWSIATKDVRLSPYTPSRKLLTPPKSALASLAPTDVDTPRLDLEYARHATERRIDVLIYDVGRWGTRPGGKRPTTPLRKGLSPFQGQVIDSLSRIRGIFKGLIVLVWGGAREQNSALSPLNLALRHTLHAQHGGKVLIFDRLRSMLGIPRSWPSMRLSGHGFSGPVTDLHARLLLTLLCDETAKREGLLSATGNAKQDRCLYEKASKKTEYPNWIRYFGD